MDRLIERGHENETGQSSSPSLPAVVLVVPQLIRKFNISATAVAAVLGQVAVAVHSRRVNWHPIIVTITILAAPATITITTTITTPTAAAANHWLH